MKPQDVVAIILAMVVVIFVAGALIRAIIMQTQPTDAVVGMWSDFIKVLLGGLIGYMSANKS